jgi:hypothetical protein
MQSKKPVIGLVLLLPAMLFLLTWTTSAQDNVSLENCRDGAFSTEEDFMMSGEEGSGYVSDGDLLSPSGQICMRNADLLRVFDLNVDLGLDAVHIVDFGDIAGEPLVAFSTELDNPRGTFTAGDLLFTNGLVIPNAALVAKFGIEYDIGLDGLQFIGETEPIIDFINRLQQLGQVDAGQVQELLQALGIDIWFSTEGTFGSLEKPILDGDLLSVTGTIIALNSDLLAPSVPAGIPQRGVDYGLDAIALPPDFGNEGSEILFSTEILNRGDPAFNDGDVLQRGNGVIFNNEDLIAAFKPNTDFLGLDALWIPSVPVGGPLIESMCGDNHSVIDFNGGLVSYGDGGSYSGLYTANSFLNAPNPGDPPRYACGDFVPVEGSLPPTGLIRFRVAYRDNGATVPAVGTGLAIRTQWLLSKAKWKYIPGAGWIKVCPTPNPVNPSTYYLLETDADGWMDVPKYIAAEDGSLTGCEHDLKLAVWNTNNAGLPVYPPGPANPEGHYILWLEWEDGSGFDHELVEHHLQLDNIAPSIAPLPDGLQVRLTDGTVVGMCEVDNPVTDAELEIWGQFEDVHYWNFNLTLKGGMGGVLSYTHNYYDPDDGPPGLKNTDDTGTKPDALNMPVPVHLRNIIMTELGLAYVKCCYYLELNVRDAVFLHSFDRITPTFFANHHERSTFITFAAAPA